MSLDLQAALLARAVYNQATIKCERNATAYGLFSDLYDRLDPMEKDDFWIIHELLSSIVYLG